jgi:hypothetical protein
MDYPEPNIMNPDDPKPNIPSGSTTLTIRPFQNYPTTHASI